MGQVPKILTIGDGSLARHWSHYLKLLDIESSQWNRKKSLEDLPALVDQADWIFLAIKDDAIEPFYLEYLKKHKKNVVHFSGALYFKEIIGLHPLQTFHKSQTYDLRTYQESPLLCDHDLSLIKKELFFIENPIYKISPQEKPLYHAMCVMAGNFPQLIWKDCEEILNKLDLPKGVLKPYLKQCVHNFCDTKDFLSGPIVRDDQKTIEKNLESLNTLSNRQNEIYQFFNERWNKDNKNEY